MEPEDTRENADALGPQVGAVFAGRFRIESAGKPALIGFRFMAKVEADGTPVEIQWTPDSEVPETSISRLDSELKIVAQLRHKNIVPCLGAGRASGGFYIVNKSGQGRTLVEHLQRRFDAHRPFDQEEAFNLFTHVCKAFVRGAEGTPHGLLRPRDIVINRNGRVQVGGFGWSALRSAVDATQLSPWDRGYLGGQENDLPPDLSSLAFLAVQLLTNAPHPMGLARWHASIPDAEDAASLMGLGSVIARVLDGDITSIIALRNALKPAFGQVNEATASMNAMDVMVKTVPPGALNTRGAELDDVVAPKNTTGLDNSLRWLVERDGIDFGPYSGLQIKEKLEAGELAPNSVIEDVETEERRTLGEFEAFETFLAQWAMNKADRDEAHQERKDHRAKTVSRRMRVWGTALIVVVVVGGGLLWQKRNADRPTPTKAHLENLVLDMSDSIPRIYVEEQLKEPAPQDEPKARSGQAKKGSVARNARRGGSCSASEKKRRSFEARQASRNELGDQEPGRPPFSEEALGRLLSRYSGRLERCLTAELQRNPGIKRMEVRGTAMADGPIYNVHMPNVSSTANCCVWRALRGAKVPKFRGTNREIRVPLSIE